MKHIKKFGKMYYIIPVANLEQSLKDINCPKAVIVDIIKTTKRNNNLSLNDYVYFGTDNNWSSVNNWDWMPLINKTDDFTDVDGSYTDVDGSYIYDDEKYTFMGYNNLTSAQKAQVLDIKQELLAQKDAIKYNL